MRTAQIVACLLAIAPVFGSYRGAGSKHNHGIHKRGDVEVVPPKDIAIAARTAESPVKIQFTNNLDDDNVHVYIMSTNPATQQQVLITSDSGVYSPVPNSPGVPLAIPEDAACGIKLGAKGSTTDINMPFGLRSARIYASHSDLVFSSLQSATGAVLVMPSTFNPSDPNYNSSWGFVEASQNDKCLYTNPTYVDFVGLQLALEVTGAGSVSAATDSLAEGDMENVCAQLEAEAMRTNAAWDQLCIKGEDGQILRILNPSYVPKLKDYFSGYIDQVWQHITANGIEFALQTDQTDPKTGAPGIPASVESPNTTCKIANDIMTCDNNVLGDFPKPLPEEIWGCTGDTVGRHEDTRHGAVCARFCAAFHRATLLLPGGDVQPALPRADYFPMDTTHNSFARIMHSVLSKTGGYTFAYDDIATNKSKDVSGTIAVDNPQILKIFVGGRGGAASLPAASSIASQASSASSTSTKTSTSTVLLTSTTTTTPTATFTVSASSVATAATPSTLSSSSSSTSSASSSSTPPASIPHKVPAVTASLAPAKAPGAVDTTTIVEWWTTTSLTTVTTTVAGR